MDIDIIDDKQVHEESRHILESLLTQHFLTNKTNAEPELSMIDLLNPELLGGDAKVGGAAGSTMSFNGSSAYDIKTFSLVDDVYKDYLVQEKKINNVNEAAKGKGNDDGMKGVETIVMTRDGPNSEFSISMWMKRDYADALPKSGQDEKQSILCSSDGEGVFCFRRNFLHSY